MIFLMIKKISFHKVRASLSLFNPILFKNSGSSGSTLLFFKNRVELAQADFCRSGQNCSTIPFSFFVTVHCWVEPAKPALLTFRFSLDRLWGASSLDRPGLRGAPALYPRRSFSSFSRKEIFCFLFFYFLSRTLFLRRCTNHSA